MKTHTQLRQEVQKWFEDRGAYVVPTNSHGYGRKGVPDLLACHAGRFYGVEIKVGPDKPSPWQTRELNAIRKANGRAWVIRSMEDLEREWLQAYCSHKWKPCVDAYVPNKTGWHCVICALKDFSDARTPPP